MVGSRLVEACVRHGPDVSAPARAIPRGGPCARRVPTAEGECAVLLVPLPTPTPGETKRRRRRCR